MTKKLSPYVLGLLMVAAVGLFSSPAFAQAKDVWSQGCTADGTLAGIWCSMSTEFRFIPKALALFAYAGGVTLFFIGLINLRAHVDDPSQTPLRDIIMKFVLGAFLISLPLAIQVVVTTVTGKGLSNQDLTEVTVARPCSAHKSAIDSTTVANAACH